MTITTVGIVKAGAFNYIRSIKSNYMKKLITSIMLFMAATAVMAQEGIYSFISRRPSPRPRKIIHLGIFGNKDMIIRRDIPPPLPDYCQGYI